MKTRWQMSDLTQAAYMTEADVWLRATELEISATLRPNNMERTLLLYAYMLHTVLRITRAEQLMSKKNRTKTAHCTHTHTWAFCKVVHTYTKGSAQTKLITVAEISVTSESQQQLQQQFETSQRKKENKGQFQ